MSQADPKKQPAIGIDLGTTNSLVAYMNAMGQPEIIPNVDGDRKTSSCVYFEDAETAIVGKLALSGFASHHDRTARWIKRRMGDPGWRMRLPEGREFSAIDLSAAILEQLKQAAERRLDTPVEQVVVTVPHNFNELQRNATMAAAEQAGLKVLRLVHEPTAAAIAYCHANQHFTGTLLVYDFGGGTFDVSVVEVNGPLDVRVRCVDGDTQLGGIDIDERVARVLAREFEDKTGFPAFPHRTANWWRLMEESERGKLRLSRLKENLFQVYVDCEDGQNHIRKMVNVNIRRSEFGEMFEEIVTQTRMTIDNLLGRAGLTVNQIDQVVVVGGSTRLPQVQKMLHDYFGQPPQWASDVDETVALGAAIFAANLHGASELDVRDVASHSYGTIVVDNVSPKRTRVNRILIKQDTQLPAEHSETFFTTRPGQSTVRCRVTQGEGTDPTYVHELIAERMPLPPDLPEDSPVEVTYKYDENMLVHCVFREPKSGIQREFEFGAGGVESQPKKTLVPPELQVDRIPEELIAPEEL